MSAKAAFKKWWRIGLLLVLISVALFALFAPGGVMGGGDDIEDLELDENDSVESGPSWHNLVFGLGLDGGARISAPPVGMTAEGLDPTTDSPSTDLRSALIDELGLAPEDAHVRTDDQGTYSAEVFDGNVTHEEMAAALSTVDGVDITADDVDDGVTEETRAEMLTVIESKLNEAGLAGGQAFDTETLGGQHFIVSEAPAMGTQELRTLLEERGTVRIEAHYPDPDGDGMTNETVLEQQHFTNIGQAEWSGERNQYEVLVHVVDERASEYQERMNEIGFTSEGVGQCDPRYGDEGANPDEWEDQYCLVTIAEGDVISAHSMGEDLAPGMQSGEWANDPTFVMTSQDRSEAELLSLNLRAGTLTAPLDFGNAQVFSVEPALAEQFKNYSLLIGILAILSVSGMVFVRYRDPRVAAPMILTAMAEVVILLGFAAAVEMPLDLAHVAGFIAVVGTGVDDLIIIADEVMNEGDVDQRRVFDSRFRKAFWIIGAAAATTIIAMSPLAVMSLGDLQGFAIVTILGVLIGVFITRPAYGDILRKLMTRPE
ncbi:preprotein translocase subunit SecD [Halovivax gelatinilyticus]|uniref:preprotein translocase subunit SecD n=1 Tax=Halovivax gelatinilyticus TaxID=2961597 RepID=UPI0020CA5B7C|nr:preprotein translocase subunit SecD [Halovivax gelatinilyticus]